MKNLKCPRCGSEKIYKNGLNNNKQRYNCGTCKKQFIEEKKYKKICPICNEVIETNNPKVKYHPGNCQKLGYKQTKDRWVNKNRDRVRELNRKYQKDRYTPKNPISPKLKKQRGADALRRYYFRERGICDGAVDFLMIKLQMPLEELYNYMFPVLNDKQVFCAITGMSRDRYLELKEFMGIKT